MDDYKEEEERKREEESVVVVNENKKDLEYMLYELDKILYSFFPSYIIPQVDHPVVIVYNDNHYLLRNPYYLSTLLSTTFARYDQITIEEIEVLLRFWDQTQLSVLKLPLKYTPPTSLLHLVCLIHPIPFDDIEDLSNQALIRLHTFSSVEDVLDCGMSSSPEHFAAFLLYVQLTRGYLHTELEWLFDFEIEPPPEEIYRFCEVPVFELRHIEFDVFDDDDDGLNLEELEQRLRELTDNLLSFVDDVANWDDLLCAEVPDVLLPSPPTSQQVKLTDCSQRDEAGDKCWECVGGDGSAGDGE